MENTSKSIRGFKPGLAIFLSAMFLYAAVSPGNLPGDTEVRWAVARQIVRGQGISLEPKYQPRNYAVGPDGRLYSFYGLGQSLLLVPFTGLGLALEQFTPIGAGTADLGAQFLASVMLFAVIGALAVWLFYRLALLLGYSVRASMAGAGVLGFATMHLHYSASTQEQTQVACLLLLAIIMMVKNQNRPRFVYAWMLSLAAGAALLFRLGSVVATVPIYLAAAVAEIVASAKGQRVRVLGKWLAAGAIGTGGFILLCGWYNAARFGSVLETGYGLAGGGLGSGYGLFDSSPGQSLLAMLFSPGKSIFLYNPVLLLSLLGIAGFYRKHKVVAWAALWAVVGNFGFHSFHTTWAGDYAWSIRYQTPILMLLLLPLVDRFSRPMKLRVKAVVVCVIALSCVIQLASVVYNFNLEFVQNSNHSVIPDGYVWDWSQSHLRTRFSNIARHAAGRQEFSSAVEVEEPLILKSQSSEQTVHLAYTMNFFPFKAKTSLPSKNLFYVLLGFWAVLLLAFLTAIIEIGRWYLEPNRQRCLRGHRGNTT